MKKLVVLACALVMALGLIACSGGSGSSAASGSASASGSAAASSSAAGANLQDFGWIAFQMPDGFAESPESPSYVTIEETANNKHVMKFSKSSLSSDTPKAADKAAKEIEKREGYYTDGGKKTIGAYEWTLLDFKFNDNPSVKAYADIADGKMLEVSIFEMTIDDPAVQTVLSTLTINQSEL